MTECERAEARAKAQVEWLRANGALHWLWCDERNRFDTRLPVVKRHKNGVKCSFTPLPGKANKRQSRRRRAQTALSGRKARAT